jgi:hypothetical protein
MVELFGHLSSCQLISRGQYGLNISFTDSELFVLLLFVSCSTTASKVL